jgi:8-oxo-dGTP pyrophosphatase MutT (NUDIX family)
LAYPDPVKNGNEIPRWRTIDSKVLAENKFLKLEEHTREESGTERTADFYIVDAPNWTNVVAITEENAIVLIDQFRQGSEEIELEVPGGIVDEGESAEEASLRELREETGYEPTEKSEIVKLGEVIPNPAFIRNVCSTYLVTNVRQTNSASFDENEHIQVRLVDRNKVEDLIRNGEMRHALAIAAIYWLRLSGR